MPPQGNPTPGWYPDPSGGGGQRYWDGRNWTAIAPPGSPAGVPVAAKAGMSKGKKIAIGVGGGIVALAAIGSIGDSGDKSKPE